MAKISCNILLIIVLAFACQRNVSSSESAILKIYPLNMNDLDIAQIDYLAANVDKSRIKMETVVILDRSGSMGDSVLRIVQRIIPQFLRKLNYDNNEKIHLITFESSMGYHHLRVSEFASANIKSAGSTRMNPATVKFDSIFRNFNQNGVISVRLLTISDGQIEDQTQSRNTAQVLASFAKSTGILVNSHAIRWESQSADTTALSSLLQLNNVRPPKLLDIPKSRVDDAISTSWAELFLDDKLNKIGIIGTNQAKIVFLKFPWDLEATSKVLLLPGRNVFWLKDAPDGIIIDGKSVQIDRAKTLSYGELLGLHAENLDLIASNLATLKVINSKESKATIDRILKYFNDAEVKIPPPSTGALSSAKKFSEILNEIANNNYVNSMSPTEKANYLRQIQKSIAEEQALQKAIAEEAARQIAPEVKIENNHKDIYENQKLDIKCIVKSFLPVDITWNLNGRILKQTHSNSNQTSNLELSVSQAKLSDAGVYKCNAVNSVGSKAADTSVNVFATPKVKITTNSNEIKENSNYELKCNIEGTRGERIDYSWLDNNGNVLQNGNSIYNFIVTPSHHNKIIKCRIQSPHHTLEDSITLSVIVKPVIKSILMANTRREATETVADLVGSDISLECIVDGTMLSTYWTKNGVKRSNSQILELKSIAINDAGKYECVSENLLGSATKSVNINVLYPPRQKSGVQKQLEVKSGDIVTIKCDLDGNPKPDKFKWWKDSKEIFGVGDKYRFTGDSLMFPAGDNDGGKYLCEGNNKYGSESVDFSLNVLTAPEVEIENNQREIYENKKLTIKCNVKSQLPVEISWSFNGRILNQANQGSNLELNIPRVKLSDTGVYKCNAVNSVGISTKETSVNVFETPKVKITANSNEMKEHLRYALKCNVEGTRGETIEYSWLDNNGNTLQNGNSVYNFVVRSTHHNKVIKCRAQSPHHTLEDSITLSVFTQPSITSILMLDTRREADETIAKLLGSDISLECIVHGTMLSTHWTKNGVKFSNGQILELKSIAINDAGKYECVTGNLLGSVTKSVDINVFYPPRQKSGINTNLELRENSLVTLECELEGYPKPKIVAWYKGADFIQENHKFTLKDGELKFRPDETDNGAFSCVGFNDHGNGNIRYNVKILTVPKMTDVNDEFVKVAIDDEMELSCNATGNPRPRIHYEKDGVILTRKKTYKVNQVNLSHIGMVQCIAENSVGRAEKKFYVTAVENARIVSEFNNVLLNSGDTRDVECKTMGSPKPWIKWMYANGDIISTNAVLKLSSSIKEGRIICVAENMENADEKSFIFKIYY